MQLRRQRGIFVNVTCSYNKLVDYTQWRWWLDFIELVPPTLTNATGTTSKKGKLTEIINDGHKYMRDDILQIITNNQARSIFK